MQDEEVMAIALLKVKQLDSISHEDLFQLLALLNLVHNGEGNKLIELKKTLAFILLIQREQFQDYLGLPKFLKLPDELRKLVATFMANLWKFFINQKLAIRQASLREVNSTKTPFSRLNNYLSASGNNEPRNHLNFGPAPSFDYYNPYPRNHFAPNNQPERLDYPNHQMPAFLIEYPNYVENQLYQPIYQRQSQIRDLSLQTIQINQQMNEQAIRQKERISLKQEQPSSHQMQGKQVEPIQPNLLRCICQQPVYQNGVSFNYLSEPMQEYLKFLDQYNVERRLCPLCTICKKHVFTKLATKPILFGWEYVDENSVSLKKILFTPQAYEIFEQAYSLVEKSDAFSIQFRALRIKEKKEANKGSFKTSCKLDMRSLKKIKSRRWMQLKLQVTNEKQLVFYAMVCISNKDKKQLISEALSEPKDNESFIERYMVKNSLQSLEFSIINRKTLKAVDIPVRGSLCQHPEPEDLIVLYDKYIKDKNCDKITCSICHQNYNFFETLKVDWWLLKILEQRKKKLKELEKEGNQAKVLRIKENRQIEWLRGESENRMEEQEEEQNSGSMSSEGSESEKLDVEQQ